MFSWKLNNNDGRSEKEKTCVCVCVCVSVFRAAGIFCFAISQVTQHNQPFSGCSLSRELVHQRLGVCKLLLFTRIPPHSRKHKVFHPVTSLPGEAGWKISDREIFVIK